MKEDTIQHLYKLREELQRARELIQEELRYLRDSSISCELSIKNLERELDHVKKTVDRMIRKQEKLGDSTVKESLPVQIIKNPVVIVAIIALALIVMVIELQNKDTGGIVKPLIENYGTK